MKSYVDENLISDFHGKEIKEFAENKASEIDYDKHKNGSTFVPVEISVTMKESCGNREVVSLIDYDFDDEGNMIPEKNRNFKHVSPLFLCPCQKVSRCGAKMIPAP